MQFEFHSFRNDSTSACTNEQSQYSKIPIFKKLKNNTSTPPPHTHNTLEKTPIPQSQNLIVPSNPAVTSLLLSCGCHATLTTGPSSALILCHILHVFQSQKQT